MAYHAIDLSWWQWMVSSVLSPVGAVTFSLSEHKEKDQVILGLWVLTCGNSTIKYLDR